MRASLYVIHKFFWKNTLNLFFAIFLPLILVLLVTAVFAINVDVSSLSSGLDGIPTLSLISPVYIVPGTATLSIICLTILSLPMTMHEFKATNTLKRLIVFRSGSYFFIAICLYYVVLSFFSYLISFLIGCGVVASLGTEDKEYIVYMFLNLNPGELLFSIFLYSMLGVGFGILLTLVTKNKMSIQIIGICIILFVMFLGGSGIPLQYAAMYSQGKSGISLWTITYINPFKYPLMLILESCIQGPAFNSGTYSATSWENLLYGGFVGLNDSVVNKMGHTSIFDIFHSFTTNSIPIPHMTEVPVLLSPYVTLDGGWDTWYPSKCTGQIDINIDIPYFPISLPIESKDVTVLIWSIYWSNIDVSAIVSKFFPDWSIQSIPTFTFANTADKLVDLVIPFIILLMSWACILVLYKKKMIQN